jgi:hypothetical protein
MKDHLSSTDLAIWITLIVGKLFLCLCLLRKQAVRRLPWFSAYVFTSTAKSLLLLALTFGSSYAAYYYAYYASGQIQSALALFTLLECARRVLPGLNLPQKEKAWGFLFLALGAVALFSSFWLMRYVEKRIEMGVDLAIATAFIFVAAYSRYLGLSWSRVIAGICSCLGMLYLVEGVSNAITGHYPATIVLLVRQLDQITNLLAVITWIVVILSPWGVREYTEADILKIEAAFARIEASLGSGGSKTL